MSITEVYRSSVFCLMRRRKHPRPRAGSKQRQTPTENFCFCGQDGTFRADNRSFPFHRKGVHRALRGSARWAGTRKVTTIQAHKGQRVVLRSASDLGETYPPAG